MQTISINQNIELIGNHRKVTAINSWYENSCYKDKKNWKWKSRNANKNCQIIVQKANLSLAIIISKIIPWAIGEIRLANSKNRLQNSTV
jgi:hypothetical protein